MTTTMPLLDAPSLRGTDVPALSRQHPRTQMRYYISPKTNLWYPSVTSVLRVINAPELERWKTNQLLDMLKTKVSNKTIGHYLKPRPGSTWAKRRTEILLDADDREYADRGTMVHTWAETKAAIECGYDPALPEVPARWEEWCAEWDKWRAGLDIEWLGLEVTGFNDTLMYAGTIDFVAYINGELVMGDYKTSSKVHATYGAQLAALRNCEYLVDGRGTIHQVPEVDKCIVVQLRPGIRNTVAMDTVKGMERFKAMRSLWDLVYEDTDH